MCNRYLCEQANLDPDEDERVREGEPLIDTLMWHCRKILHLFTNTPQLSAFTRPVDAEGLGT
jgi:hypothetical protein